ncbi:MAG: hypothetical protein PVI55_12840 [Desulfobacterales bacterium]|jgi:hypothetical protein
MMAQLKRTYFILLLPPVVGFILTGVFKAYAPFRVDRIDNPEVWAATIFILSITTAIALPTLYRTIFAHRNRDKKDVSETELLNFEKRLIYFTLTTPYLALASYVLEFSRFYTTGTILTGLYAIYYFFPSGKRLALDQRIFRVK